MTRFPFRVRRECVVCGLPLRKEPVNQKICKKCQAFDEVGRRVEKNRIALKEVK